MIIRHLSAQCQVAERFELQALTQVVPAGVIREVLQTCQCVTQRERKLNLEAMVWLLIGMNLYTSLSLGLVLEKVTHSLRLLSAEGERWLPTESALTYRRYQLGARPLWMLFRRVCRPMATPDTPGAFLFGLRLMALDGHITNVPDTPENAAYFGRKRGHRGEAAYPQVQGVYLSECGTHALVDAAFWPVSMDERIGVNRLLRSVEAGMLVMWDRGLHSYDRIEAACERGAQVLGRLPASVKPKRLRRLSDGTWLVWLAPSDQERRAAGEGRMMRLIEYTLDDPARPGHGQVHRLITTLLDPLAYPARDLCEAYHARWEEEVTFDEVEVHQQKEDTLLRSRKPVGVLQELYALLIAHYAVRFLMYQAAQQEGIAPTRLSFTRSLHLIGESVHDFVLVGEKAHPQLYARLLKDLARQRLPERRRRGYPRVVKRKMSNFDLKRAQHKNLQQPTKPFREAIVLI